MAKLSAADYRRLDAVAMAALVRDRQIAPHDLLEAAFAEIDRLNPLLNAVVVPMREQARTEMAALDPGAPLAGVPFLLKDFLALYRGVPTSGGARFFAGDAAPIDSELVARYRRAGLTVIGKASTSEFAIAASCETRLFGSTRNPWDSSLSPGGSSGGSAAAVAARMVPAAHATDGGGSIRIPASACGLFGLKPSRGRISMAPAGEGLGGCAAEHVVSRTVRDSAALLDATAGALAGDPYTAPPPARPYAVEVETDPPNLTVAYSDETPDGTQIAFECRQALREAAQLLESLGHRLVPATPKVDWEALDRAFFAVMAVQTRRVMALRAGGRPFGADDFEPVTWAMAEAGQRFSGTDYLEAIQNFHRIGRETAPFFASHDLLLTPTLAMLPPKLGHLSTATPDLESYLKRTFAFAPFTRLFNVTGQPAMSVPLHWTAAGLPVGIQLVGPYGAESLLFQVAGQLERARPWHQRDPFPV
jgi:Asp-tRNA(Asn)/Glu-tRNA(Gln) amidotransferase A subunit family amidase